MDKNAQAARNKKIRHALMLVLLIVLFLLFIFPFILVVINVFKVYTAFVFHGSFCYRPE